MKIYLVGGAVRDTLLGKPIQEKDWVVVGATPEMMRAKGFQPVGKDFPVFLHPTTHEEYALARTERKTGKGYKGFHFYAAPDVSLEADLLRRDLTINAMAQTEKGNIIDPYGGQTDLANHCFRHVSPAFAEDPVRILRVARFSTIFPDFHIHPDTQNLMQNMVKAGEIDALVAERVWKELSRALSGETPQRFFEVLLQCNALRILFPEFIAPNTHLILLQKAAEMTQNPIIRFCALLHGLSRQAIKNIETRFRAPTEFSDLVLLTEKYYSLYATLDPRDASAVWKLLKQCDGFRRPKRFDDWMSVCKLVTEKDHRATLRDALSAAKQVNTRDLLKKNLKGPAFAEALKTLQIEAIFKRNAG